MRTWRFQEIFGLLLFLVASCGNRSLITSDADSDTSASGGGVEQRACGHGLPCNPSDLGGRTCESLGLRAGQIGCDPKTCHLVLTKCGGAASGSPGTVTGATGTPTAPGAAGAAGVTPGLFGAGAIPGLFGGADGGVGLFGGIPGLFGGADGGGLFGGANNGNNNGNNGEVDAGN